MEPKKERYRRVRGMMLKFLAHQHPHPLDGKVLFALLDDVKYSMSDEEFDSHVTYLVEKGLVKRHALTTGGVRLEMVTICPDGLDVLDGFKTEVGVDARF